MKNHRSAKLIRLHRKKKSVTPIYSIPYDELIASYVTDRFLRALSVPNQSDSGFAQQMEPYRQRDVFEEAKRLNSEVEIPDNFTLQLDLDTDEQYKTFYHNLKTIEKKTNLTFAPFDVRPSKSGYPHRHVVLKTKTKMGLWQRLALQFMLASDPKREFLNGLRVLQNDLIPIALFRR